MATMSDAGRIILPHSEIFISQGMDANGMRTAIIALRVEWMM
jgi:hypothetical protein